MWQGTEAGFGQQPGRKEGPLSAWTDKELHPANIHVRLEVDPSSVTSQVRTYSLAATL